LLTAPTLVFPDLHSRARLSHSLFHQNAAALQRMFKISQRQAKDLIATCPDCQCHRLLSVSTGVNSRGLHSLDIWQADIMHVSDFGHFKYVPVSVDTFSGAPFASCHTGETARNVCHHFLAAFASLGVPRQVKTDNGPAYTSQRLCSFFQQWGVTHLTGI
ncbi:POK10 protein, partial [Ptilonorhynchus violaceus]|nr:POK10 protein [Ptilonorhynchus violaceus]